MEELLEGPRYELIKELGNGVFGFVFKALDKTNNSFVAIKRLEKVGKQLSREFEVLNELKQSDHCVKLLDIFYTNSLNKILIQNMVFEYLEDDLEKLIQRNKQNGTQINENRIKCFSYQLLSGLKEMHQKNIMHRDLKPENILRNNKDVLKIADFGSAKFIEKNSSSTPYIVSRYYRAPELILSVTKYNQKIDIWAIGCIIIELLILDPLFKGKNEGDQFFAIYKKLGSLNRNEKDYYSTKTPMLAEYIDKLPEQEIDSLFWNNIYSRFSNINMAKSFFQCIFKYLPNERLEAEDLLLHPFLEEGKRTYERM